MGSSTPTAVLVPGGFLGPWVWEKVERSLRAAGIRTTAVPLRSVLSGDHDALGDLYADAAAVRQVLDRLEPPVVLCGHSYGGAVITEAAGGPHPVVRHLVYLAAAAPDTGESLTDLALQQHGADRADGAESVHLQPDGTIALDPASAAAGLFNDCDDQTASQAAAQLRPMSPQVGTQPITTAAWRQLPTTYVRCMYDQLPELVSKQFFDHAVSVVELPTGHCPQWSRPGLVAELLLERIRSDRR